MTSNVVMANGEIFPGEKIDELVNFIINKFAEEKMSVDKAKQVLYRTQELIGECSEVKAIECQ